MTASGGATIQALAPGKVVLWGEYAVLAGAPALVMAVDRYASCSIASPGGRRPTSGSPATEWQFSSTGFVAAPEYLSCTVLRGNTPPPTGSPAWTAWQVLRTLNADALPDSADVAIDTSRFYREGTKLGLGSSAAVCVALYGAFCALLGATPDFPTVAAAHHRLQGNLGSGIDVAAAWFGGLLRFQRDELAHAGDLPDVAPWELPAELRIDFVWAGHPAATTAHLQRFADWRAEGDTGSLHALIEASAALFEGGDTMERLRHYVRRLSELDQAAGLAIYDPAHQELHRLAVDSGVVYKPCGAGGGDIGAAFSYDPRAIERFMASARARGYAPITLETAPHGIDVRR